MNKKVIILIISLLLVCGCGSKEKIIYEYYVTVDNVDIKVDSTFEQLKKALYEYNDIKYRADSDNIVYSYNDMEIETYLDGKVEKVKSVWFTSNKYNTNEGVRIGDSVNKMIDVYGDNFKNNNGIFVYKLNNSSLSFIVENDIIIGVEYNLV